MALQLNVKIGQAIQVGPDVIVRVARRRGSEIKLIFETKVKPIRIVADGLGLEKFTTGLSGEQEKA